MSYSVEPSPSGLPSSANGTIIYALIYSITGEGKEAKDEIIRPFRSAPMYEESILRFKVVKEDIVREITGRRVSFDLKIFEDSNLIVEAKTPLDLREFADISYLKKIILEECRKLTEEFRPGSLFEEYIFFCLKDYEGTIDSFLDHHGELIAALLKDEPMKLASKEIEETLDANIRYGREDVAIVDWDGAFLIDSTGEFKETIAVLELAIIQLLNYRIMDRRLAERIDLLKRQGQPIDMGSFLRLSPFMKNLIRMRSQSVLELEDLESALRLYGDWYSGKLYDLASKKFHLHTWRAQVEAKLQLLADLYEMAEQVTEARFGLILEFLIVVLIVLEIVLWF
ncbi:MAG: hypothetical protein HPY61_11945 [Methanotrichaceae archaeon]|nr:hypothetical protein [Methanotrichaceae archaeon]